MEKIKFTSLGELSRDKKINVAKSKLNYYNKLGLIKPVDKAGGMYIYNEEETIEKIKLILQYQKQNISLKEIKKIFDNN